MTRYRQDMESLRRQSLNTWADAQRRALHEAVRQTPVNVQVSDAAAAGASGTGSGGSSILIDTAGPASMLVYVEDSIYKLAVVNYEASTISTAISTNITYGGGSYLMDGYVIAHNGGFMPVFYNAELSRTECFFVSVSGNLLDTIVTFGGFGYGSLDFKGGWFADYEPDNEPTTSIIFKMFDGQQVVTHQLQGFSNISVGSNDGEAVGDLGVFVTLTPLTGDIAAYLLRWDGSASLVYTQEAGKQYTTLCHASCNFIVAFDQLTTEPYNYTRVRKWQGSALQLASEFTMDGTAIVNDWEFLRTYGTNKAIACFYNYSDSEQPYLIYQAGENNAGISYHNRGEDFIYANEYVTQKRLNYPANYVSEKAVVTFNGNGGGGIAGFNSYTHFDVRWWESNGDLNELKIAGPGNAYDGASMFIGFDDRDAGRGGMFAKDPVLYYYNKESDPVRDTLILTVLADGGAVEIPTGAAIDSIEYLEVSAVSTGYFLVRIEENTVFPAGTSWTLCNADGVVGTSKITSRNLELDNPPVNLNTILVVDYDNLEDSFIWTQKDGFSTPSGLLPDTDYIVLGFPNVRNDFGTANALAPGRQVLLGSPAGSNGCWTHFFLLDNENGWRGPFQTGVPASYTNYTVQLGETLFYHIWYEGYDVGNVHVDTYSMLTGQRISRYDTGATNITIDYDEYGDRILIQRNNGNGTYTFAYPTKTGEVKTITVPNTSFDKLYNDAYWSWD